MSALHQGIQGSFSAEWDKGQLDTNRAHFFGPLSADKLQHSDQNNVFNPTINAMRDQLKIQLPELTTCKLFLAELMKHCNIVHRIDLEYAKYKLPGYLHTPRLSDFTNSNSSNKTTDTNNNKRLLRDKTLNEGQKKVRQEDGPKVVIPPCTGCGKPHARELNVY